MLMDIWAGAAWPRPLRNKGLCTDHVESRTSPSMQGRNISRMSASFCSAPTYKFFPYSQVKFLNQAIWLHRFMSNDMGGWPA